MNSALTLTEINYEIRKTMDGPDVVFKLPATRMLYEAQWFAENVAKHGGSLAARLPDGTVDDAKAQFFRDLDRAQRAAPVISDQEWEGAGYVYNEAYTRGPNAVDELRMLADALEAAVPVAPAYAADLLRHARNVREILAKSRVAAQAAVRHDVLSWRFVLILWSVPAVVALIFLWGRPISFSVGVGFLICIGILSSSWRKVLRTKAEITRRCAEIGWPLTH